MTSAVYSGDGSPPPVTLAAYRAFSASQSRNYDRAQDISPRQMITLLEVAERTGASLGQALATGEFESAHTWNDHVRPSLKNGNLGSATGVWQFQPATFHNIVKTYGAQLLAASEADLGTGRERLDLGEGPFTDAQVRHIIQETADGKRGAKDEELQLLRHNFAVLAFARHYLSVDFGAVTPEEDYLNHFLGEGQARRVLALARGDARDTLCVKPVEVPIPPLVTEPERPTEIDIPAIAKAEAPQQGAPPVVAKRLDRGSGMELELRWARASQPSAPSDSPSGLEQRGRYEYPGRVDAPVAFPFALDAPRLSAEWGLPADSSTVTGNLGMFYRDGKERTQPYTWAEFMENLAQRVQAKNQPALVRAKYGVGFSLKGGDLPERAFNPDKVSEIAELRHENGLAVLVAEALVTGPLNRDETQHYKQRLAGLVKQGEDKPLDTLPPAALSALHRLRMLPPNVRETATTHPQVRKALHNFRKKVGKGAPDDPAHVNLLMPAERIALEIYEQRLARYAALQAGQQASIGDAPNLKRIGKMPKGLQRLAAPHVSALQTALAAQGLLTKPVRKSVWRDKKRRKHVTYKTLPFAGKADKATVAALSSFQLRNGLRKTEGVLDAVTLSMLGLPPMGPEIFRPLSGPQCPVDALAETAPICACRTENKLVDFGRVH